MGKKLFFSVPFCPVPTAQVPEHVCCRRLVLGRWKPKIKETSWAKRCQFENVMTFGASQTSFVLALHMWPFIARKPPNALHKRCYCCSPLPFTHLSLTANELQTQSSAVLRRKKESYKNHFPEVQSCPTKVSNWGRIWPCPPQVILETFSSSSSVWLLVWFQWALLQASARGVSEEMAGCRMLCSATEGRVEQEADTQCCPA